MQEKKPSIVNAAAPMSKVTPPIVKKDQYLVSMTAFYKDGNTTSVESKGFFASVKDAVEDVAFFSDARHYEIKIDLL